MSRWEKTLERVMSGRADANIRFDDAVSMLVRLGFEVRIRGSHHLFSKQGYDDINLQPSGALCKPYQVRQMRQILKG